MVVRRPSASKETTPRGDGLQHGLDVAAALLQLGVLVLEVEVGLLELALGEAQIVGHAVEGVHQHADLVVGPGLHLVAEVPGGHLARALHQLLDGAGDAAGQVEAEPGDAEHDDQGDEHEEEDEVHLDRRLEEPELLVLLEGLGDAAHLGLQALGHVRAHDDQALRPSAGRPAPTRWGSPRRRDRRRRPRARW